MHICKTSCEIQEKEVEDLFRSVAQFPHHRMSLKKHRKNMLLIRVHLQTVINTHFKRFDFRSSQTATIRNLVVNLLDIGGFHAPGLLAICLIGTAPPKKRIQIKKHNDEELTKY